MRALIRFHLDEHVDVAIARGLRRRGVDMTTTRDVALAGASDEDQLAYVRREQRVIVTHDRDFLRLHKLGQAHAGIAYCHLRRRSIGEIIQGLLHLRTRLPADRMQDRVEYL